MKQKSGSEPDFHERDHSRFFLQLEIGL